MQIIEEHQAYEGVGKIRLAAWQRFAQRGRIHESRNVIEGRRAKKRFDDFQDERTPVCAGNPQVALKESPEVTQQPHHEEGSSSGEVMRRPVSFPKASSSEPMAMAPRSAAGVSNATRFPWFSTATRSARNSISCKVCEAKSSEVPRPRSTSAFSMRRKSAAA